MPDTLRDGKGRGYLASVNQDQQLVTRAIGVEQRLKSTIDAHYYEAATGQLTISDAAETFIIYVQNDDDDKILVIDRVFWDIWESTGGTGGGILKYYLKPTITGGTVIIPNNTNFGSTNTMNATCLRSLTTMAGTVWWTGYIAAATSVALEEGRIVLPSGSTFGISAQAPAGNTSMKIAINVAMYNFNIDLV